MAPSDCSLRLIVLVVGDVLVVGNRFRLSCLQVGYWVGFAHD